VVLKKGVDGFIVNDDPVRKAEVMSALCPPFKASAPNALTLKFDDVIVRLLLDVDSVVAPVPKLMVLLLRFVVLLELPIDTKPVFNPVAILTGSAQDERQLFKDTWLPNKLVRPVELPSVVDAPATVPMLKELVFAVPMLIDPSLAPDLAPPLIVILPPPPKNPLPPTIEMLPPAPAERLPAPPLPPAIFTAPPVPPPAPPFRFNAPPVPVPLPWAALTVRAFPAPLVVV
jgi:hypothetical protein